MSAIYFAAFETNQKENVSMEKSKLPRKGLNIIMFCKAQLNAEKITKPELLYAYKCHAYKKGM